MSAETVIPARKPFMMLDFESLIAKVHAMLSVDTFLQAGWIIFSLAAAYFLTLGLRKQLTQYIQSLQPREKQKGFMPLLYQLSRALFPLAAAVLMALYAAIGQSYEVETSLASAGVSLTLAWMLIGFITAFIQTRIVAKWFAVIVWLVAALHIVGWWESSLSILDSLAFTMGKTRISILMIFKGLFYFAFFLWLSALLSRGFERQIRGIDGLTPSLKVLFVKLAKITFMCIALLFGLNAIGVDLTAFAIFSGALGVGLGFGLQKVVSNFISGIILLMDRSIKPGDVIALGAGENSTFGWVNTLGARYVSIIQRDGKEHLIPNELLITEKVENWSFSNNDIRLNISVGVSYKSDVRKAQTLVLEALEEEPRIKKAPEPVVHVTGFGDSSVDMEGRGWINDPVNGIQNVKSAILLRVWDKFHENDIEIPFPQRDLHVRSVAEEIKDILKSG